MNVEAYIHHGSSRSFLYNQRQRRITSEEDFKLFEYLSGGNIEPPTLISSQRVLFQLLIVITTALEINFFLFFRDLR